MKFYEIENLKSFDPKHSDYIVALSDYSPEVKQWSGKKTCPIKHKLWYYLRNEFEPYTYTVYYKEKLGVQNENEARIYIDAFNKNNFLKVSFEKIIKMGLINYGVIRTDNSDEINIMSTDGKNIQGVISYISGYGGYRWGSFRMEYNFKEDLMKVFSLNEKKADVLLNNLFK